MVEPGAVASPRSPEESGRILELGRLKGQLVSILTSCVHTSRILLLPYNDPLRDPKSNHTPLEHNDDPFSPRSKPQYTFSKL